MSIQNAQPGEGALLKGRCPLGAWEAFLFLVPSSFLIGFPYSQGSRQEKWMGVLWHEGNEETR